MKKASLIWLLIWIPFFVSAQGEKDNISKILNQYFSIMEGGDLVKSLDFTYPKFFEVAPREKLEEGMKNLTNDSVMRVSFESFKLTDIDGPKTLEGVQYSIVSYSMISIFQMLGPKEISFDPDDDEISSDAFVYSIYESKYGKENVEWNKETRTFKINATSKLFAIKDPAYGNKWSFMERQAGLKMAVPDFFPASVWEYYEQK